jgi:DNA polymerase alpha subunit A
LSKKKKTLDTRLPSPAPAGDLHDDDGYMPTMDDDLPSAVDVPMSDPAPSSPAAKVAQRKRAQIKQEPKDDEEEEDMMEVAHASAVATASVNMAGARPVKKLIKSEPLPTPATSSPLKPTQTDVDSSSWNALTDKLNVVSSPSETRTVGKIDHNDAVEADGSLNFFWTDYTEVNGSLCLFGKVLNKKTSSYVSCFVKVDNILRKLYFLPRQNRVRGGEETDEEVEMMDVYSEVDEIMTKMNVGMHKIKQCTRKYAFEVQGIPKEAQYMKLLYPYTSKSEHRCGKPWSGY